jgi:TetR/AcrR family transcriptional regulator, copper-responsive repressor
MNVMRTGRPKNFNREEVLDKAIPVFWKRGFSDATLADLEAATGVNRSGLYTEFKDKEDLFLASLRHYLKTSGLTEVLAKEPFGWGNVERYLKLALSCWTGQKGCFSVSSMRELEVLPREARSIVAKSMKPIKDLLVQNIEAEGTKGDAGDLAELVMTFFSGISIEQNLASGSMAGLRRIDGFMRVIRSL